MHLAFQVASGLCWLLLNGCCSGSVFHRKAMFVPLNFQIFSLYFLECTVILTYWIICTRKCYYYANKLLSNAVNFTKCTSQIPQFLPAVIRSSQCSVFTISPTGQTAHWPQKKWESELLPHSAKLFRK